MEQGEDVTISRRGVFVQAAVEKLLQLRDGLVLEGYLRAIARDGDLAEAAWAAGVGVMPE